MTERQRLFVEAYQDGGFCNATEAARRAGYSWPNKQGPRLMQNPAVALTIEGEFLRRHPQLAANEASRRADAERVRRRRRRSRKRRRD